MKKYVCGNCNKIVNDSQKFCHDCGKGLKSVQDKNELECTCPKCGHTWKKFEHKPCKGETCPKCGEIIGTGYRSN